MNTKYDNRTDPLFKSTTCTNSVNLGITTLCTMRCPKCSVGVPVYKGTPFARHAELDEIKRDAKLMRPMRRVHLTGGEPTMHPHFSVIAMHAREWFEAMYLTLETNGAYYMKYRDLFSEETNPFDRVFITHYLKDAIYPGSPDNTAIIEVAEKDLGDLLIREPPVVHSESHLTQVGMLASPFHPLDAKQGLEEPFACSKYFEPGLPCGWYNGRLWKCCVSVGIDLNFSIPVTPDWREKIMGLTMGCRSCCYRGT